MTKTAKTSGPVTGGDPNPNLDRAAIDARDFRTALGSFATGVTIITAQAADGRIVGLTCNSFASVSLNPAMVLWSLGIHSPSMQTFQEASHFAVNVLGENQSLLAEQFARSAVDKFTGVAWQPGLGGAPVIAGCIANFQCSNAYRYYGGDHIIFLGAVEAYAHTRDEPLLFARGVFGGFARPTP
jgi:flavin reductase (DIM6/NTAB) family NADH-FMN oxidoreductase RutF